MKISFVTNDLREVVYEGTMNQVNEMLPQVKSDHPGIKFTHAYPTEEMSELTKAVYF